MASIPRSFDQQQRARQFRDRWQGERRERAEKDTFWNEFFAIYGIDRRARTIRYEHTHKRRSTGRTGFSDVFWPGRILVEHKSRGEDLVKAMEQALDYEIPEEQLPAVYVVCDFNSFHVRDRITGEKKEFTLQNLPVMLDQFGLTEKRDRRRFDTDEAVNFKATELINQFGKALEDNGYPDHERRVLLTRIVFCLFADDAGVWEISLFEDYIRDQTKPDGSDLGSQLERLFQLLATDDRRGYPEDMLAFTYINGGLFGGPPLRTSVTDRAMRQALLDASKFNWSAISPAIFGSMFQNVMEPAQRRNLGAHYTSETNIMKLIRPLFLDGLEAELRAASTQPTLRKFLVKLSTLTFLDPASGCGNFLVVTYRHLRRLETEALGKLVGITEGDRRRSQHMHGQAPLSVELESGISVNQFHGIEIEEWPCEIAKVAMHIQAHLCDMELVDRLETGYVSHFPIVDVANIVEGNALLVDWNEVLPAELCNYVMGNPPFVGRPQRSVTQTNELRAVWGKEYFGDYDYVTGWIAKASLYAEVDWAFVTTNSVFQGYPAARLWRSLEARGWNYTFAHRTLNWTTEAQGRAAVHVSIVGMSTRLPARRMLTVYDDEAAKVRSVENIGPFLCEGPSLHLDVRKTPRASMPLLELGSLPADGGHLILDAVDMPEALNDPVARRFVRQYVGALELLHGKKRWCFWLADVDPAEWRESRLVRERVELVRRFRSASVKIPTQRAAMWPHQFTEIRQPVVDYLAVPRNVSEARRWLPTARLKPDVITSEANFAAADPDGTTFAVLSSGIFLAWALAVSGRFRSTLRLSNTFVYNNFPLPDLSDSQRHVMLDAAQGVLSARTDASLADQYDVTTMPRQLVDAHVRLDRVMDRIFEVSKPTLAARQKRLFELADQDRRR